MREMPATKQPKPLDAGNLPIRNTSDRAVRTCLDNIPCGAVWAQQVEAQLLVSGVEIGMHLQYRNVHGDAAALDKAGQTPPYTAAPVAALDGRALSPPENFAERYACSPGDSSLTEPS